MFNLAEELKRPMADAGWTIKVLIGAAFSLAFFWHPHMVLKLIFFPLTFFSMGYLYRIFVNHFQRIEEGKLTEWKDWKEIFLKGLVIFLIVIFMGLLAGQFFFTWQRRVKSAVEISAESSPASSNGEGMPNEQETMKRS